MSRLLVILIISVQLGCDSGPPNEGPTPYRLDIPEGFPDMVIPAENPLTEEGVALGKKLFFDPILSIDSTVSCASCHAPSAGFSDTEPFSRGVAGVTNRNSMPIINPGWMKSLFWDGRATSLEDQALHPVENVVEMGESWPHVISKLQRHPEYPLLFSEAFGTTQITTTLATRAIAQYERTLISANTKYDRFRAGLSLLTEEEQRGFDLFFSEKADCFHCHGTRLFTDNRYHNNGLDNYYDDLGLAEISEKPYDAGKFKTPTLRNIAVTGPYMHDGRFETLEQVIDFYNEGTQAPETIDPLIGPNRRLNLTEADKQALLAFLNTLTDPEFLSQ